jgi:drug/metabolite transporter (DMT)-like permease
LRAIILGIGAAFFFAFTFVLNRMMDISGGSWIWSASLRYLFMVPLLLIIVLFRGNFIQLMQEMRKQLSLWMIWSFVGFVLFYAPLCFASAYSPGWLIAGTWQITIISGSLLAPLFINIRETPSGFVKTREKIPLKGLSMSFIILLGIMIMQYDHASKLSLKEILLCIIPIIIASFAYPLGNRKMMEVCKGNVDAYQRVLGMTLASLPFWLILFVYGLLKEGLPGKSQVLQAGLVALFSGVCATVLFFAATDLVKDDIRLLSGVEATQSAEIVFALIGEMIFIGTPFPSKSSLSGLGLVILGMILHSILSSRHEKAVRYSGMDDKRKTKINA